nr:hypothetical protein [Tanacetum cinerariifolium]
SGTGEGTGSKPGVSDVPSDDSEEELSWKSSKDEEVGSQEEGNEYNDDSDDGSDKILKKLLNLELTAKDDKETKKTGAGGDEVREMGGEKVSFDPIRRTPKESEKESDDDEEQESRLREEARIQEEEDAEELYRDVNINQGRGLQVTQSIE